MTRPLRSSPITGPSTLLPDGPPLCPTSVLSPSRIRPLGVLPCLANRRSKTTSRPSRRTTGSHLPRRSPTQARATSMPDTTWPISRLPPGSSRAKKANPVLMSSIKFRHVISGLLSFAFLGHTCRTQGATSPATLATTALYRSNLRVVYSPSLQSDCGGPKPSINCAAPPQRGTDLLRPCFALSFNGTPFLSPINATHLIPLPQCSRHSRVRRPFLFG